MQVDRTTCPTHTDSCPELGEELPHVHKLLMADLTSTNFVSTAWYQNLFGMVECICGNKSPSDAPPGDGEQISHLGPCIHR